MRSWEQVVCSKAAQNKFNPKKLVTVPDIVTLAQSNDSEECFTTGASQNGVSPQSAAAISSMSEDSDSKNSKGKRGRPCLTDPRSLGLGPDLRTFVINFVHSRGQDSEEAHRKKLCSDAFGAPLDKIAKAAGEKFGCKISRTAVWNMMMPPHCTSVNTQRGDVGSAG